MEWASGWSSLDPGKMVLAELIVNSLHRRPWDSFSNCTASHHFSYAVCILWFLNPWILAMQVISAPRLSYLKYHGPEFCLPYELTGSLLELDLQGSVGRLRELTAASHLTKVTVTSSDSEMIPNNLIICQRLVDLTVNHHETDAGASVLSVFTVLLKWALITNPELCLLQDCKRIARIPVIIMPYMIVGTID